MAPTGTVRAAWSKSDLISNTRQSAARLARVVCQRSGVVSEITESIVMELRGGYHATLARLCSNAIRFATDGFGTRYSSLKYLQSIKAHKIQLLLNAN